ncbi:MAG: cysteine desulfurase [Candidatus Pacebacteria bacterium]|nr:cysteine desulfurase [Candidatus Paceibacterota bacterium]
MIKFLSNKKIYLDNAGATPLDKKVAKTMAICERKYFSNPSAIFTDGVKVRSVIDEARLKIAKLINAHSDEIIFTGSGTESDALALLGVVRGWRIKNKDMIPHIITTKIEHPAILENCRLLESLGESEVTYISVNKDGIIKLEELEESLKENTVLVSVMYANNEIGTIQPIQEIAKIIRRFRKQKKEEQIRFLRSSDEGKRGARPFKNELIPPFSQFVDLPYFHTDACQAVNYLFTENIEKLGVDLMTFNSSKIYGPKGVGILYKKRNIELCPLYGGGGQEFGLRSGTESAALITSVAEAFSITNKIKQKESERLIKIRDYGIDKLLSLSKISGYKIILNGDKNKRLPNNINISVSGISSELLVIELSARSIFVSEKSACKGNDSSKSYVIDAIRKVCPKKGTEADGSLRISLGRDTKKGDMDILYKSLKDILIKYKKWK